MSCCKSCDKGLPCEGKAHDEVGAPPATGTVTCDTSKCVTYLDQVDAISLAMTQKWQAEVVKIVAKVNAGEKISGTQEAAYLALLEDADAWANGHRKPWIARLDALKKDCDSTFPGPCKDAIGVAALHEKAIVDFDARFKEHTGKSTGVQPIAQTGPNGVQPSSGGIFSGSNGPDLTKYILLGVLAYIAVNAARRK